MFVNDGVCDYDLCCDGTEEYSHAGGVQCGNRCVEIGKEWRRIEKERTENLERANKKRRTMVKEAKELRRQVEARVTRLEGEIKDLEKKEAELTTKFEEVERSERGRVVKNEGPGKLGVLAGLAKARINELREALSDVVDERKDLQEKVAELEGILSAFKEEYNPNFNDEGVKKAVRAWEDYAAKKTEEAAEEVDLEEVMKEDGETSGINWKDFEEEEVTDTDIRKCFYLSSRTTTSIACSWLTYSSVQLGGLSARPPPGFPPRQDPKATCLADRERHASRHGLERRRVAARESGSRGPRRRLAGRAEQAQLPERRETGPREGFRGRRHLPRAQRQVHVGRGRRVRVRAVLDDADDAEEQERRVSHQHGEF